MTTPCLNRPTLSLDARAADLEDRMRHAAGGEEAWATYAALLGVRREMRIREALRQDDLAIPCWPRDLATREAAWNNEMTAEQAAAQLDSLAVPGTLPADPNDDQESFAASLVGAICVFLCAVGIVVGIGVVAALFGRGW